MRRLVWVLAIAGCSYAEPRDTMTVAHATSGELITGTVSSRSGQRLYGATIIVGDALTAITLEDGRFVIEGATPGDYPVQVIYADHVGDLGTIHVRGGAPLLLAIRIAEHARPAGEPPNQVKDSAPTIDQGTAGTTYSVSGEDARKVPATK